MSRSDWDWRRWGTASDLIHQSDLNGLVGKFGCPEQFRRKKIERATEGTRTYESAGGKLSAGNAVHSVIHRILKSDRARATVLRYPLTASDQRIKPLSIAAAYDGEFESEVRGRPVDWYRTNPEKHRDDCLAMLGGLFENFSAHVGEVMLPEAAFVYPLDGLWLTGSIDLIYRARLPSGAVSPRVSFADWKTGAQRPHQIDLDHGWQSGIYAGALREAYFVPHDNVRPVEGERHRDTVERVCGEIASAWQRQIETLDPRTKALATDINDARASLERVIAKHGAVRFDEYPEQIRYVHLRDYIPYARKTARMLDRPEELVWAGLESPTKVSFAAGDWRGPAWYRVQRAESDLPRLRHLLRAVVSWVRFGRFPAAPGEMCSRCRFREPCLLDGYQPIGDEAANVERVSRAVDFDGITFDDL